MQPVHVVESVVSQEMQNNWYYHFMVCVRPSSHMNVPPPPGTTSLKRSTQERLLRRVEKVGEPVTVAMTGLITFIQLGLTTSLVRICASFQGP